MKHASWTKTLVILRRCGAPDLPVKLLLTAFLLLTPLSAVADALSWLLLVFLFAGAAAPGIGGDSFGFMGRSIAAAGLDDAGLLMLTAAFFLLRALLALAMAVIDGRAQALLRRGVQERLFGAILSGNWRDLRGGQVGLWVGALTEEASSFAKYLMSAARAVYNMVAVLVLAGMALALDARTTLILASVGAPAWLLLKWLYGRQTDHSVRMARARQGFSADVTERLTGLFQIKAAGEEEAHARLGTRRQDEFTGMETSLGLYHGIISAFNLLMLPIMLAAFGLFAEGASSLRTQIATLGGVGILGYRAMSQLSQLVAAVGNLSRLVGCVEPLYRLATLAPEKERRPLPSALRAVRLDGAACSAGGRRILSALSVRMAAGRLFLIVGPSGVGKSTLANLAAGLIEPDEGKVVYEGADGRDYDALRHRARIGYVPQDVHLMRGTVRENLDPLGARTDAELSDALKRAGAEAFLAGRGGLSAEIAEAGRSLSGGEKRRLAIAHALASKADALILDEVTNGLDDATKAALVATIAALARETLVIAITHDLAAFTGADAERLELFPSTAK